MTAIAARARQRLDGGTLALALACLPQLVRILDAAVVAVALPSIQADRPRPADHRRVRRPRGRPAVFGDASALADGYRAAMALPALAALVALHLSASMAQSWRSGSAKELERQNAALVQAQPHAA